jgi:hypothetical protein
MRRLVPLIALVVALTGCAAIRASETRGTEQLLTTAGFQVEPAAAVEERARLRELEPRAFVRETRNGEARHLYADPDVCRCLYTGTERQYRKFHELQVEQGIAEEQASAVWWTQWDRWPWP